MLAANSQKDIFACVIKCMHNLISMHGHMQVQLHTVNEKDGIIN